jgi:hypothetical protein
LALWLIKCPQNNAGRFLAQYYVMAFTLIHHKNYKKIKKKLKKIIIIISEEKLESSVRIQW